jgi:hypothetical protein
VKRPLLIALASAMIAIAVIAIAPPLIAGRDTVGDPAVGGPLVLSSSVAAADQDGDHRQSQMLWESKANSAIVAASNVRPGFRTSAAEGQVTIINLVSPAVVALQEANVTFTCPASATYPKSPPPSPAAGTGCASTRPGYGQGNLSVELSLTVTDTTTSRLVFNGPFAGTGGAAPGYPSLATAVRICGTRVKAKDPCPAWEHGEAHTLTFQLTFPNTVRPAGFDNAYQGTRASAAFQWGTL